MLEEICAEGGFRPRVAYTVADVGVARALVAAGVGVAILGERTLPAAPGVVVRPLPSARTPTRAIFAGRVRNRRVPTVDRMLPLALDAAAAHMGSSPAG